MKSRQMVQIAMKLTEAIIEVLKKEFNEKDKVTNANKKRKSNRVLKAGRQNSFRIIYCSDFKKIQRQVNLKSYREPSGSLQLKN